MDSIHSGILITKERAQRILDLFRIGKDETMIFEEDCYDYEDTLVVGEEFRRLEKEIKEKIGDCKNELELSKKLESKILNPREVIDVVIKRRFTDYDGYATFLTLKKELI